MTEDEEKKVFEVKKEQTQRNASFTDWENDLRKKITEKI